MNDANNAILTVIWFLSIASGGLLIVVVIGAFKMMLGRDEKIPECHADADGEDQPHKWTTWAQHPTKRNLQTRTCYRCGFHHTARR